MSRAHFSFNFLLRDDLRSPQILHALPVRLRLVQFGLLRLAQGGGLQTLLLMGAVDEPFEFGPGQGKLGLGQGHLLAILPVVEPQQHRAGLDGLPLMDQNLGDAAGQLRPQLDLDAGAFNSPNRGDRALPSRRFKPIGADLGGVVDHHRHRHQDGRHAHDQQQLPQCAHGRSAGHEEAGEGEAGAEAEDSETWPSSSHRI